MGMAVGGRQRPKVRHQHDADDRRAAGADHHLHGDHAAHAEGTGGAGAAAAATESAAAECRWIAPWSSSSTKTRR